MKEEDEKFKVPDKEQMREYSKRGARQSYVLKIIRETMIDPRYAKIEEVNTDALL